MIVSDHGMTETGNHGGSTYEETDSLALFVGLGESDDASTTNDIANQVDLAPTLALLFGVPIPKNNVGILMAEVFRSFTGLILWLNFLVLKCEEVHEIGKRKMILRFLFNLKCFSKYLNDIIHGTLLMPIRSSRYMFIGNFLPAHILFQMMSI